MQTAKFSGDSSLSPDKIMQIGLGFLSSKALLSAVELGLFNLLARGPMQAEEIGTALGLHPRGLLDFLDTLVALGVVKREGGCYSNSEEADAFLVQGKPGFVGGMLQMANARLYPYWGNLTEALRTGEPQNEHKRGEDVFEKLYSDPERLKLFLTAMSGISMGAARALAAKFPWQNYRTVIDVGAAQGCVPAQLALAHPHLTGGGFDLEVVAPVFNEYIASFNLADRLKFYPGNFFKGSMPSADVLIMGHILHDWDLPQKKELLAKAHAALPSGGALIVYEALIDDERKSNVFGLLMSLNMLIETTGGFDYTGADCSAWMKEAGFRETRVEHLAGPDSMVVGIK
jgi:hypothetical protein